MSSARTSGAVWTSATGVTPSSGTTSSPAATRMAWWWASAGRASSKETSFTVRKQAQGRTFLVFSPVLLGLPCCLLPLVHSGAVVGARGRGWWGMPRGLVSKAVFGTWCAISQSSTQSRDIYFIICAEMGARWSLHKAGTTHQRKPMYLFCYTLSKNLSKFAFIG